MEAISESPEQYKSNLDQWEIKTVARNFENESLGENLHLIIAADVLCNNSTNILKKLANSIKNSGFIILEENQKINEDAIKNTELLFIAQQVADNKKYILLKKNKEQSMFTVINIQGTEFGWLDEVKSALKETETGGKTVLLVNQCDELLGYLTYFVAFFNVLILTKLFLKTNYFLFF